MRRKLGWRIAARLPQTIETSGSDGDELEHRRRELRRAPNRRNDREQHAGLDDRRHVGRHRHARPS